MNDAVISTSFRCGTIAIVGRSNVGKSTLMNALIGQKISITSRKVNTTRSCVIGINTLHNVQFVFIDTPGFQSQNKIYLNCSLNREIISTLTSIDVILFVIEAVRFLPDDQKILSMIPLSIPTILIANKLDRVNDKKTMYPFIKKISLLHKFTEIVPLSANRRDDIDYLLRISRQYLPEGKPIYTGDNLTNRDLIFLTAEILREKIFRWTGGEIPYTSNIIIEKFNEKLNKKGKMKYISATIVVERNSQKSIVIGKKGEKLKRINIEARIDMERIFKVPVYLETFLRVKRRCVDNSKASFMMMK